MISLGVYIVVASAVFLSNYSVQGQIPETKNYQQIPRCRNPNELWYDLMPTCALTCATVGERCPDPAFSAQVSGCACKPGFHRNGPRDNDPCVTTKQCLRHRCNNRPNEIFKFCGDAAYCEPTCGVPDNQKCDREYFACPEGCQCEKGFKRDPRTNLCVPSNQCPRPQPQPRCNGPNEEFSKCTTTCRDNCDTHTSKQCTQQCSMGCRCIKNHKRIRGRCVPEENCRYYNQYFG